MESIDAASAPGQRQASLEQDLELIDRLETAFGELDRLQQLTIWQRDSLIRHRAALENLERQLPAALDELRHQRGLYAGLHQEQLRLTTETLRLDQRITDLARLGDERLQTAGAWRSKVEGLIGAHTAQLASLDHDESTIRDLQRQVLAVTDRLDQQRQLDERLNDALGQLSERSDLLWNSRPWQLYCRLGGALAKIKKWLSGGHR